MVLSDRDLRKELEAGRIILNPYDPKLIQPSSVDVRLGHSFRVFDNHLLDSIDLKDLPSGFTTEVVIDETGKQPYFVLHPGEFILGETLEVVTVPDDLVSVVEGKSSLGRLGLIVHATAGWLDPGFSGSVTLEMTNLTRIPIRLYPELPIAQLVFQRMTSPAEFPYGHASLGSHYQGQRGATESRYDPDRKKDSK
jgi:dCTP deaminase